MRNTISCLISILLLSTLIAKATMLSTSNYPPIANVLYGEKNEKIDCENEIPASYDQLKNDELLNSCFHHPLTITISYIHFIYTNSIIPSSYLRRPERPPKKDLC